MHQLLSEHVDRYLNILSYFQHSLQALALQGGRRERGATTRKRQKGLEMAWGCKFRKGVNLLSFSTEEARSHIMDPRKWGQRPHTYLSSFLESSTVKFKGEDECHCKGCVKFGTRRRKNHVKFATGI